MDQERNEKCKYIQAQITKLCQTEIDEVFKILHNNKSSYTQNNNGVFVNLNWTDEDVLDKIHDYILFCLRSQSEINKHESMKNMINYSIANRDKTDEEKPCENTTDSNLVTSNITKTSKVSSSMKFYFLKKKFQKKSTSLTNNINNVLIHEEYISI